MNKLIRASIIKADLSNQDDWWDSLTKEQQDAYLKLHTNSHKNKDSTAKLPESKPKEKVDKYKTGYTILKEQAENLKTRYYEIEDKYEKALYKRKYLDESLDNYDELKEKYTKEIRELEEKRIQAKNKLRELEADLADYRGRHKIAANVKRRIKMAKLVRASTLVKEESAYGDNLKAQIKMLMPYIKKYFPSAKLVESANSSFEDRSFTSIEVYLLPYKKYSILELKETWIPSPLITRLSLILQKKYKNEIFMDVGANTQYKCCYLSFYDDPTKDNSK